jgi:hypothetical protein
VSELVNDVAVVGLFAIAGWLIGARLIPDGWVPSRRASSCGGRWRAVVRVVAGVAVRVPSWAGWRSGSGVRDRRCGGRSGERADR